MKKTLFITILAFSTTFVLQATTAEATEAATSDWELDLGAVAFDESSYYQKADNRNTEVFPSIHVSYQDLFFFNSRDGLGFNLHANDTSSISVGLGYVQGRDGKSIENVKYMDDIESGAAATINAKYHPKYIEFGFQYSTQVSGQNTGSQAILSVVSAHPLSQYILLSASLDAKYTDNKYTDSFFGIDESQATKSSVQQYNPSSGIGSIGVNIVLICSVTDKWKALLFSNYNHLQGSSAASPLVIEKQTTSFGIGLSYSIIGS